MIYFYEGDKIYDIRLRAVKIKLQLGTANGIQYNALNSSLSLFQSRRPVTYKHLSWVHILTYKNG